METLQLVKLAKMGQRSAFAELVARYQRAAIARAWSVTGDFHFAQDIAQDGFVIAFGKLDTLQDNAAFAGWLLEIIRREAIRRTKQRANENSIVRHGFASLENFQGPDPLSNRDDWQQRHADTIRAINRLPPHEQEVVILRYLDQQPTNVVAKRLNRPLGTVTKQLSRAIKRLRTWLSEVPNEIE